MNELQLLTVGVVVLLVLVFQLFKTMDRHKQMVDGKFNSLSDQLGQIKDTLEQLKDTLNEIYYNTRPLSEKEELAFESARPFSISDVRQLQPGDTLRLISLSYIYPTDEPYIVRFEYKHDHLDESDQSQFGCGVHGFWRLSATEEWSPYEFLAKEGACTTASCEGTIKRLL
jgi:hypothetical protein